MIAMGILRFAVMVRYLAAGSSLPAWTAVAAKYSDSMRDRISEWTAPAEWPKR